jgi:hypothetical protein
LNFINLEFCEEHFEKYKLKRKRELAKIRIEKTKKVCKICPEASYNDYSFCKVHRNE